MRCAFLIRLFLTMMFTLATFQTVQAADWDTSTLQQKCGAYASASVRLATQFHSMGCSSLFRSQDPNRWTRNYKVHYNWCMWNNGQNLRYTATETKRRLADIMFCRNRAAACRDYANGAVTHYRKAKSRGCTRLISSQPDVFNPSYQHHFKWCMGPQDWGVVEKENYRRGHTLTTCSRSVPAHPPRRESSAPSSVRAEAPPAGAPHRVRVEAPPASPQMLHFSGTWQRSRGGEAQVWQKGNLFTWRVTGVSGNGLINGRDVQATYQAKHGLVTVDGRVNGIGKGNRATHIDWSNGTSWSRSDR